MTAAFGDIRSAKNLNCQQGDPLASAQWSNATQSLDSSKQDNMHVDYNYNNPMYQSRRRRRCRLFSN